jgi:hypothetical protein
MRKILIIPVFLLTFLTLSAQKPVNDECSAAVDLTNILPNEIGQTNTSELFTNVASTGEKWLYPALKNCGWYDKDFTGEALKHPCPECGAQSCESPSVDQTVWFKFTGDGEDYQIRVAKISNWSQQVMMSGDGGVCSILEEHYLPKKGCSTTSWLMDIG